MSTTEETGAKRSKVEHLKESSHGLRGRIAEELANSADAFEEETAQLLKHHGMYQQDDRDLRGAKGPDGKKLGKAYSLMVRTKLPGGKVTWQQLLDELDLCDRYGNGTLRLTNRQDFQMHAVLKRNVREVVRRINEAQMTTLGACGDVERNVLCCPAPLKHHRIHEQLQELADRFSTHFLPRSRAYHEVWLTDPDTGEKELVGGGADGDSEPFYGNTYLPRKFKTAIALPHDNCIDVYANDLGLIAVVEDDQIIGFNVVVGGGFGITPSNKNTFPAVAKRLCFVEPENVIPLAEAIIGVWRDHGNRADRKRARLKYLLADWGLDAYRAKVEEYYGRKLADPHPTDVHGFDDHIGWYEQGDGNWFYGLNVENGRILDRDGFTLKSALREICQRFKPALRVTAHQSILFGDIRPEDRSALEDVLRRHGVKLSCEISTVRRWSMACVALPTCPLAVTESERVMPALIDQLEAELARLELSNERFTTRMTGCPNGCARTYNAEIGLVGKTLNKYTIYLGGRLLGDRLAFIYKDLVPLDQIVPALVPVLAYFKRDRQEGESLGDFCHRKGPADLLAWADQHASSTGT